MSIAESPSVTVRPLRRITPQPLSWLWQNRLALGKPALLDGDPGLGKSLVAFDLCARLSTGRPLPDGSPGPGVCSALILNGEDGEEDTIGPRLERLGADPDRIFVFDRLDRTTGELIHFPAHTPLLERALAETGACLLVIDPVMAFLSPRVQAGSDTAIRRALFPLVQLAEKYPCVILLVRHLNKKQGSRALYRGTGSIAFAGLCRSSWLLGRDPHDSRRCVLAQVKNNLAPPQPSLAFTLLVQEAGPPALNWQGPCSWTCDQLLAAATGTRPIVFAIDRARDFLLTELANGPRTSREIWLAAEEQGVAERTIIRAKRDLEIRSVRVHQDGTPRSYWLLPGQQMPGDVPPEAAASDLEEWLAPLRKQFPPGTPLDDV